MKLVSVSLENYRQHRATTVEFSDGVTGIIGANGAGKSSLVEALAFALYGTRVIRGRVDDLVSRGAPEKAEPKVVLVFDHDGASYRVERTTGGAELYVGGEAAPIASGTREVTARVSRLLGMSHEEFSATFYTEQKGLEFLGGQRGGTERERFIVRTLGYDRLEKIQELLRVDKRELRALITGIEASLGLRDEIEARLTEEDRKLREAELVESDAARQLADLETEYEQYRKRFLTLDAERQAAEAARREITLREVRYAEAAARARALESELSEAQVKLRAFGEARGADEMKKLAEQLSAATAERSAELAACERELSEAEESWRERTAQLRAEHAAVERAAAELDAKLERGAELSEQSECPTCGRPVDSDVRELRKKLTAERDALTKTARKFAADLKRAQTPPAELESARKRRDELRAAVERARERHREYLASSGAFAEREQELAGARALLTELDRELRTLRRELGDARFSEEEYRAARAKFETSRGLTEVKRLERVRAEGEVVRLRSLIERTRAELAAYDERARVLKEKRAELLVFDESDRVVTEFRKHLNASLRPQLAELASFFLADLTDGRYSTLELGDDFSPQVIEDGSPKPVISGGEEDIVNLSLRLALSQMIAERSGNALSLLVLDEIFGSLDDVRRGNVLALLEKLRSHFEQILVITHIEEVKEAVQNVIAIEYDEATGELATSTGAAVIGEVAYNF